MKKRIKEISDISHIYDDVETKILLSINDPIYGINCDDLTIIEGNVIKIFSDETGDSRYDNNFIVKIKIDEDRETYARFGYNDDDEIELRNVFNETHYDLTGSTYEVITFGRHSIFWTTDKENIYQRYYNFCSGMYYYFKEEIDKNNTKLNDVFLTLNTLNSYIK